MPAEPDPMTPVRIALATLILLAGCEARLSLGSACSFESDCPAALRCAGGRCREECREDRDCTTRGDTCIRFGGAGGVCTPPSSAVPCALNSDCGPGARCEAGECHQECSEDIDCELLGVCTAAGICERPFTTAPAGDGGVLPGECTGGRVRCPGRPGCIDLATERLHCGACENYCPAWETCRAGACFCDAPSGICGGACVSLDSDEFNCGACGASCGGQCSAGHCCPSATPRWCGDTCVDTEEDGTNCGACGRTCGPGEHCHDSGCRPPEDECAGAIDVTLTGPSTTVALDASPWVEGAPSCDARASSGYVRFVLDEPSIVALVVHYTGAYSVGIGVLVGGCSASGVCGGGNLCSGNDSFVVTPLPAGEHAVVVTTPITTVLMLTLRIDVIPLAGAVPIGLIPATGDLVGHLDATAAGPHCGATGASHAYWHVPCGTALAASSCDGTLDTVLSVARSGAVRCADPCTGGTTLPAAPGPSNSVEVVFVSARDATASGDYRVALSRP